MADLDKAVLAGAGAKLVTPYYNCRCSTAQYSMFFVMEYPNIEAASADSAGIAKFDWYRYVEAETIPGSEETA